MKRMALALIILISAIALIPYTPVTAQSGPTPHENPATAATGFDIPLPILLHYGDILSLLANGDYKDARDLLAQLNLDQANIPADLKYLMQTYNDLLSDLTEKLDSLDSTLNEAELLLKENKLEEIRLKLGEAGKLILEAEALLEDIDTAMEKVISLLGPLIPPAEAEAIDNASDRLQEAMDRLNMLQASYEASLQTLEIKVTQTEELSPSDITLETVSQAWVGDTLTVSGILTGESAQTLPNRKITLILDKVVVTTTTTNNDGRYETEIKIPYLYLSSMEVQASYVPEGEDAAKYSPSLSPVFEIETQFYTTQLQIESPEQAYPGLPFKISGRIISDSEASSVEREIKILLDNKLMDTLPSNQDGFEIEVTSDDLTLPGEHILTVIVAPQDRYSGTSRDITITLVKETPEIRVDNLSYLFLSRKVQIKGYLHSDLPLQSALVNIEIKGVSTTVSTSAEGEFEATLNLPLDSISMGSQEVRIKVEPSEAWHSTTETTAKVFVIDITNIGLTLAAFVCIGLVLYTARRGKPGKGGGAVLKPLFISKEPVEIAQWKLEGLTGTKARVLKAYTEAAGIVEAVTKIPVKPHMTLREFLAETKPGLEGSAESFTELTHLAENALYSPYATETEEAVGAEKLAFVVEEMLRHGKL